jgi:transcriptional/translational regulatory protein YebC/TACO1
VSWLFHRKSRFVVTGEYADEEKLLELLFEAGADIEEVTVEDGEAEIIGAPEAFGAIVEALEAHGIPVSESGLTMIPETTVELTDAGRARQVVRLIETLEDDEDVQQVYSNFSLPEALMETLAAEG